MPSFDFYESTKGNKKETRLRKRSRGERNRNSDNDSSAATVCVHTEENEMHRALKRIKSPEKQASKQVKMEGVTVMPRGAVEESVCK